MTNLMRTEVIEINLITNGEGWCNFNSRPFNSATETDVRNRFGVTTIAGGVYLPVDFAKGRWGSQVFRCKRVSLKSIKLTPAQVKGLFHFR